MLNHDSSRPRITPFGYQSRAIDGVYGKWDAGVNDVLVVMATGTGKTVVGGLIARDVIELHGGRVLWLAHRELLVQQAVEDLSFVGVEAAVEMAGQRALGSFFGDPAAVVASVQSLHRKPRLMHFPRDYFKAIITDEAHHGVGGMYETIYEYFDHAYHLGLTATPDRLDGQSILGSLYKEVAFDYELEDAIREGSLCPVTVCRLHTNVDLRNLSTRGKGDFSEAELEEALMPHIQDLVNLFASKVSKRPSIVFTPGVRSAQAFASALSSLGIGSRSIYGDHPDKAGVRSAFRAGEFQVLVNCQIETEGANFPFVSCVGLARKTTSRALLSQMIGRGTRLRKATDWLPNPEPNCLILDFSARVNKQRLATPWDLLKATAPSEHARRLIEHQLDADCELDLLDSSHDAEIKAERVREIQAREDEEREEKQRKIRELKLKVRRKNVKHRAITFDPFEVLGGEPPKEESRVTCPITLQQMKQLQDLKIDCDQSWSIARARLVLDEIQDRADNGKATIPQVNALIVYAKMDPKKARSMSKAAATALLGRIFGSRRKKAS